MALAELRCNLVQPAFSWSGRLRSGTRHTEPLVSLLDSAETSLNCFARELGFIGDAATDVFFFGQSELSCLTCLFKKVIFINLILSSLHKHPKLCFMFPM